MATSAEPGIVMTQVMAMSLAFFQRTTFGRSEDPMPMIDMPLFITPMMKAPITAPETWPTPPIAEAPPTADQLEAAIPRSGLPAKRFFNTSGQLYRDLGLKDRVKEMSREEIISLLATDGMLVKRPILVTEDAVLVGFKEAEWESLL